MRLNIAIKRIQLWFCINCTFGSIPSVQRSSVLLARSYHLSLLVYLRLYWLANTRWNSFANDGRLSFHYLSCFTRIGIVLPWMEVLAMYWMCGVHNVSTTHWIALILFNEKKKERTKDRERKKSARQPKWCPRNDNVVFIEQSSRSTLLLLDNNKLAFYFSQSTDDNN